MCYCEFSCARCVLQMSERSNTFRSFAVSFSLWAGSLVYLDCRPLIRICRDKRHRTGLVVTGRKIKPAEFRCFFSVWPQYQSGALVPGASNVAHTRSAPLFPCERESRNQGECICSSARAERLHQTGRHFGTAGQRPRTHTNRRPGVAVAAPELQSTTIGKKLRPTAPAMCLAPADFGRHSLPPPQSTPRRARRPPDDAARPPHCCRAPWMSRSHLLAC